MKNLFKYVFMLMVVAMGAVVISSCGGDDDDSGSGSGSGSGSASNGTFVLDGTSYKVEVVELKSQGNEIENEIELVCASRDAGISIETMDKTKFPTTLQSVKCWVVAGTDEGGDYEADNVSVQCCVNGTKCKFIINNANINGHTVSLTFDDDASKYTEK